MMLAHREGYRSVEHLKRLQLPWLGDARADQGNVNCAGHHGRLRNVENPRGRHHDYRPLTRR